jgi:non-ribosomal peptide synthase protein (TIGR01720 family)
VVDAVSWRLLLEDTIDAYRQACRGDAVRLPAKTSSYQDWARHLTAYCRSEALLADKSYWRVVEAAATPPLRTDAPPIRHRYDETRTADFRIAMLDERMPESTIQAVLLAALARALVAWDGRYVTRVMLTCHGRLPPGRGVDVSRTVGWFTAEFPFLLRSPQSDDAAQNMRDVAHQLGEALPRAVGYGILRWLAPEDLVDDLTFGPRPEVTVNYIGRAASDVGEGFSLSDRLPGASFGLLERTSLLDVEAMTDGPDLAVSLRYCPAVHRHATAQELCDLLRDELTAALAAVRAAPPIFLLERAS